jgi:hypothetical protein
MDVKAQVSLEYLLLSVVALFLLSVSVVALLSIRDYSADASKAYAFRSSSVSLSNAINEVCALGNGNGREVSLEVKISLDSEENDGWLVSFSHADYSMVRASPCRVHQAENLEGLVYIENEEGEIAVTGR